MCTQHLDGEKGVFIDHAAPLTFRCGLFHWCVLLSVGDCPWGVIPSAQTGQSGDAGCYSSGGSVF